MARALRWLGLTALAAAMTVALAVPVFGEEVQGSIAGRVTAAGTGEPVQATVEIYSDGDVPISFAHANEDGTYVSGGLEPGTYRVGFVDTETFAYQTTYYNGKATLSEADAVVVAVGQTTSGIDAALEELPVQGGWVSGTVVDADEGDPIPGVHVAVSTRSGLQLGTALTDGAGTYRVGPVGGNDVIVAFWHDTTNYESQWYMNKPDALVADAIAVGAGEEVTGIDAALRRPPTGTSMISGTIVDAETGVPACATIQVFDLNGFLLKEARPSPDGTYRIDGLPAVEAKVKFEDNCDFIYLAQWWNGQADSATAAILSLIAGEEIAGIDAAMRRPPDLGGWITGRVFDVETGDPVCVSIEARTSEGAFVTETRPDLDGSYRLADLGTGEVKVRFVDSCEFIYQEQWWNSRQDFGAADLIAVEEGVEVSDIDGALVLQEGVARPTTTTVPTTTTTVATEDTLPATGTSEQTQGLGLLGLVLVGVGVLLVAAGTRRGYR